MISTGLEDSAYLDRDLASQVEKLDDIESAVDLFQEALVLTCKKILQNTSGNIENDQAQFSSMVNNRVNSHEEKNQLPEKKISKNYEQRRPKRQTQKSVPRKKDKISSSNKKGEN
jgi:hypothetical protein